MLYVFYRSDTPKTTTMWSSFTRFPHNVISLIKLLCHGKFQFRPPSYDHLDTAGSTSIPSLLGRLTAAPRVNAMGFFVVAHRTGVIQRNAFFWLLPPLGGCHQCPSQHARVAAAHAAWTTQTAGAQGESQNPAPSATASATVQPLIPSTLVVHSTIIYSSLRVGSPTLPASCSADIYLPEQIMHPQNRVWWRPFGNDFPHYNSRQKRLVL